MRFKKKIKCGNLESFLASFDILIMKDQFYHFATVMNDHVTTVSSGENSPYSTSVPDHFELVYTAQNNFTLTFTLNYFFPPNRLLTSGAGATKKLPEGNQHNLSISCIYKIQPPNYSKCDHGDPQHIV